MRTTALIMTVVLTGCGGDARSTRAGAGAGGPNAPHTTGGAGGFDGFGASGGVRIAGGAPAARGGTPSIALDGSALPPHGKGSCGNPRLRLTTAGVPTGFVDCDGRTSHRTAKVSCVTAFLADGARCPYAPATPGIGEPCRTNADCTSDIDAHCATVSELGACLCHYGCSRDEDCGDGRICDCHDGEFGRCASATCTTDSDCAGTLCRGTPAACEGSSYACEGPMDVCESDLDCAGDLCTLGNGTRVCGAPVVGCTR